MYGAYHRYPSPNRVVELVLQRRALLVFSLEDEFLVQFIERDAGIGVEGGRIGGEVGTRGRRERRR